MRIMKIGNYFEEGIKKLIPRFTICIGRNSDYVENSLHMSYQYKRKTWKGKMIKNILIKRKESDAYLGYCQ